MYFYISEVHTTRYGTQFFPNCCAFIEAKKFAVRNWTSLGQQFEAVQVNNRCLQMNRETKPLVYSQCIAEITTSQPNSEYCPILLQAMNWAYLFSISAQRRIINPI
jgi:hypothetical protein